MFLIWDILLKSSYITYNNYSVYCQPTYYYPVFWQRISFLPENTEYIHTLYTHLVRPCSLAATTTHIPATSLNFSILGCELLTFDSTKISSSSISIFYIVKTRQESTGNTLQTMIVQYTGCLRFTYLSCCLSVCRPACLPPSLLSLPPSLIVFSLFCSPLAMLLLV